MGAIYGAPYLRVVTIANPAAGAEFTLRTPGESIWRVLSVRFRFTTDATVAGREVALIADDGTNAYWQTAVDGGQAASLGTDYATNQAFNVTGGANVFRPLNYPPEGLWLGPGNRLRTSTLNIQAGDQFSAIVAQVQEFHSGPGAIIVPLVPGAIGEVS